MPWFATKPSSSWEKKEEKNTDFCAFFPFVGKAVLFRFESSESAAGDCGSPPRSCLCGSTRLSPSCCGHPSAALPRGDLLPELCCPHQQQPDEPPARRWGTPGPSHQGGPALPCRVFQSALHAEPAQVPTLLWKALCRRLCWPGPNSAAFWLESRGQERKPDSPMGKRADHGSLQLGREVSICTTSRPQYAALWEKGPGSRVKRLTAEEHGIQEKAC